jgi:hypothetical protein
MADEITGTPETHFGRFTEALDSLRDIVRAEITLIGLEVNIETRETPAQRQRRSDQEKGDFLKGMREELEKLISSIAENRRGGWGSVNFLRADDFEAHAKFLRTHGEKAQKSSEDGVDSAFVEEELPELECPPGFTKVDGICVPI